MFESILSWIADNVYLLAGVTGVGGLLGFVLRRFATEDGIAKVGTFFNGAGYYVGRIVTLGLAKWKYSKPVWNKIVEPFVIIFLKVTLRELIAGLVRGLESDNRSLIDD